MILALGLIAAISGAVTFYLLKPKQQEQPKQYSSKPYEYKGVRKTDFIKERVFFYPYNYVNG